jgi:hypothetical protein
MPRPYKQPRGLPGSEYVQAPLPARRVNLHEAREYEAGFPALPKAKPQKASDSDAVMANAVAEILKAYKETCGASLSPKVQAALSTLEGAVALEPEEEEDDPEEQDVQEVQAKLLEAQKAHGQCYGGIEHAKEHAEIHLCKHTGFLAEADRLTKKQAELEITIQKMQAQVKELRAQSLASKLDALKAEASGAPTGGPAGPTGLNVAAVGGKQDLMGPMDVDDGWEEIDVAKDEVISDLLKHATGYSQDQKAAVEAQLAGWQTKKSTLKAKGRGSKQQEKEAKKARTDEVPASGSGVEAATEASLETGAGTKQG